MGRYIFTDVKAVFSNLDDLTDINEHSLSLCLSKAVFE